MTNTAIAAPVLFAVVATITPGGATTLVTASGAQFGFRRCVPLIAGIAIGFATLAAAAAAGLAGLLLAAPSLQLIVTLTGSAYLVYLAWIGRSGPPGAGSRNTIPSASTRCAAPGRSAARATYNPVTSDATLLSRCRPNASLLVDALMRPSAIRRAPARPADSAGAPR